WLSGDRARPLEARLSSPGADRYRPYEIARGPEQAPPPPLPLLARLEAQGKHLAIAEAYLERRAPEAARPYLDRAGQGAEALSSPAGLGLRGGRREDAVGHAGRARSLEPQLKAARWNRALALRELGLSLTAAADLDEVAASNEPGWASEAKQ